MTTLSREQPIFYKNMTQEIRLYTPQPLKEEMEITLDSNQSHYLAHVMRCTIGDYISLFNGIDGQWQTKITSINKKSVYVLPLIQTRLQTHSPDLWLVFAPIKNKTELVVEKATELGVSKILPIVTHHCVVLSINMEKLRIHTIMAAQQCERLDVPTIETHKDLSYLLGEWKQDRTLLYGDETGGGDSLSKILDNCTNKIAVLIGPEGGFATDEIAMLRACGFAKPFGMGPRILRADTATIAALACVQSQSGDWDEQPHFIRKN